MASWKRNELGVFFFCFRQEHRTEDKQAMAIQSHFLEPLVGASLLAIFSSKYSLRERDMTAQTSTLTIWAKAKNMKRKEHQQFFRRFLPSKVSMGLTRRNQLDQTRSKSKSTKLYPPPLPLATGFLVSDPCRTTAYTSYLQTGDVVERDAHAAVDDLVEDKRSQFRVDSFDGRRPAHSFADAGSSGGRRRPGRRLTLHGHTFD